jgi:hypothetical protein
VDYNSAVRGAAAARKAFVRTGLVIRGLDEGRGSQDLRPNRRRFTKVAAKGLRTASSTTSRHKYGTMTACGRRSIFPTRCTAA